MGQTTINGSHGEFSIDENGIPVGEVPEGYQFIKQVDMKTVTSPDMDILLVGYWYEKDGERKYEPPEKEYQAWLDNIHPE